MENYNYNYNQFPENYQIIANSIPKIPQQYYPNNLSNSYQFYEIKTYDREKLNQIEYDNMNYPQTLFYRNDFKSLSLDPDEDFGFNYSKGIQKIPKDSNKIPQDNFKNKQIYDELNQNENLVNKSKNYNSITTINNNNFNKINSINIIFDANNIYNNDCIQYNNINFIKSNNNNYIPQINSNNTDKSLLNIEKQPKDNYKNYSESSNQMNNFKSNISMNSLIRLKKSEPKNIESQDNSIINISKAQENKNNSPKNNEQKKSKIDNNNTNNLNTIKIINNPQNSKIKKIEYNNQTKNKINKIEKIKTNNITSLNKKQSERNNKNKINKVSNLNKNINKIFQSSKLNNNNNKIKEAQKQFNTKKLTQTKSYVNKHKFNFLKRRNTYQKNELNKNFSFNIPLKSTKSKEKDKSNFASLINKRKLKMFSSLKQIDNSNKINSKESMKGLSQKNDIIYENIKVIKDEEKSKNKLEESNKISRMKQHSGKIDYHKRLYTPQESSNCIINKYTLKETKNKNYSKKKGNTEITRNISYYKSFNSKKKELFKKKVDLSTPRTLTLNSSINRVSSKFKTLNRIQDSIQRNKKEGNNINILNTEQSEQRFVNPTTSKRIKINKSDKNVLELSNKNIKDFNQKTSDFHLNKKHIFLDNQNSLNSNSKKYNKNNTKTRSSLNKISINSKNYLSMRNSTDKLYKKNNNNYPSQKTTRIAKKQYVISKNKDRDKSGSGILNQKKNLYTFRHKTQRKNSFHRHYLFSEEKREFHNTSYRGFSAFKKLEEIKKKYKFRPQTKEKKNNLRERNINYIEESKGFAKLLSSTNLIEKSFNDKNDSEISSKSDNKDNNNDNNIEENSQKSNKENDIKNDKSFILDLNNVIPINEKELINTVNRLSLSSKTTVNRNIEEEKRPMFKSLEIKKDEKDKNTLEKSINEIKLENE